MCSVFRHYVIYFDPLDFRGEYVVRGWTAGTEPVPDVEPLAVVDALVDARAHIPPEADYRMEPMDGDEDHIAEVWM